MWSTMYIHTSKTVSIWSCKLLMILEKNDMTYIEDRGPTWVSSSRANKFKNMQLPHTRQWEIKVNETASRKLDKFMTDLQTYLTMAQWVCPQL